jgi:hypothetical protein
MLQGITTITTKLKLFVYEKSNSTVAAQHRDLYGQLQ